MKILTDRKYDELRFRLEAEARDKIYERERLDRFECRLYELKQRVDVLEGKTEEKILTAVQDCAWK